MAGRAKGPRGYTLIEIFVALAIVGILGSLATWQITRALPAWRADALARRFTLDLRQAQAIAARTNRTVELRVQLDETDGCPGPGYRITGDGGEYDRVCLTHDYRGVTIATAGAHSLAGFGCELPIPLDGSGCTFCDGGEGALQILPTGEVLSADGHENGEAILFAPTSDAAEGRVRNVRGVAIRTGTGTARAYRLTAGASPAWECP